jgi:hypothetical protein
MEDRFPIAARKAQQGTNTPGADPGTQVYEMTLGEWHWSELQNYQLRLRSRDVIRD